MSTVVQHRVDNGRCRNPSLNVRPEQVKILSSSLNFVDSDDELIGVRGNWWWTGKHPELCPGFDNEAKVLRSLPLPSLENPRLRDVLDYFDNCWTLTEVLFACLQGTDAFLRQPYHQLRHPMIFYYGHTAALYINKFRVAGLLEDGINQFLEQILETGVDEMSWDDLSRGRDDWPSVRTVHAYRRQSYGVVRQAIEDCFRREQTPTASAGAAAVSDEMRFGRRIGWDDPAWTIFLGFEHERIHIETSSVLIRELPLASVIRPAFWPAYHSSTGRATVHVPREGDAFPSNPFVDVPIPRSAGGSGAAGITVRLGKSLEYPSFGWDNEYGRKDVCVRPFTCQRYKVTNGEFLAFVRAGGYADARYWSRDGWGWRAFRNAKWPTFWMPDGPQGLHRYRLRLLFDAVPMQWDWPVDVNFHEAKAFALWRARRDGARVAYRLISEAEHNLLRNERDRVDCGGAAAGGPQSADPQQNPDVCMEVSGHDAASRAGFNFQLAFGSQSPVQALPPSEKGFYDVLGNAWEWAEDHYAALPGFKVHPVYEDFSSPCFGGLHQMILGGSFVSTGQLASKFARYQFRPHFFQHASFRLVAAMPSPEEVAAQARLTAAATFMDKETQASLLIDTASPDPEIQKLVRPFFVTSCMDSPQPHVTKHGGPCCTEKAAAAAAGLSARATSPLDSCLDSDTAGNGCVGESSGEIIEMPPSAGGSLDLEASTYDDLVVLAAMRAMGGGAAAANCNGCKRARVVAMQCQDRHPPREDEALAFFSSQQLGLHYADVAAAAAKGGALSFLARASPYDGCVSSFIRANPCLNAGFKFFANASAALAKSAGVFGGACAGGAAARVLDLGSSAGRGSFELSRYFGGGVLGVEQEPSLLEAALRMRDSGMVRYFAAAAAAPLEVEATLNAVFPAGDGRPQLCDFVSSSDEMPLALQSLVFCSAAAAAFSSPQRGAAVAANTSRFDAVFAANLLDRICVPPATSAAAAAAAFFAGVRDALRPGGVAFISTMRSGNAWNLLVAEGVVDETATVVTTSLVPLLRGVEGLEVVEEGEHVIAAAEGRGLLLSTCQYVIVKRCLVGIA